MANLARIGILAGSAALVSMEANVFYSRNDGASEWRKVLDIWKNARAIRRYRVYNCSVYMIIFSLSSMLGSCSNLVDRYGMEKILL